jgi:deferrochelatase/peroxidase EfeB
MRPHSIPAHIVRPTRVHQRPLRADLSPEGSARVVQLLGHMPGRLASSDADNAPPPMRLGADACLALPSRVGDRLHYRDGRVTDMQGNPIAQ